MKTREYKYHSLLLSLIVLLSATIIPVYAQQFMGRIRGVVNDTTGAVVAGAEVAVININTNQTTNLITDQNGAFVAPQLNPGLYRVVVKKSGFKSATIDEVKIDVQQLRELEVTLEVGQATDTVTVLAGGAAALETISSTVSQTIENKRVVDLPLNGRNPFSLATLSPGVIPGPGSSPFISGGRNATSEVTIDGVTNVNAENNVSILDLNYTPSVDAVQEFSVQTNSISAEFGRFGGGVINLVTKSGTNNYHVTLFEFLRNSALDANNFFSNRAGIKRASFKRNQFGGNFGGPIRFPGYNGTDKSFFFVNYEGLRQRNAAVTTQSVPLAEWRQGDFRNLKNSSGAQIRIFDPLTTRPNPNYDPTKPLSASNTQVIRDQVSCNGVLNVICANRINPVAKAIVQYWPLPNTTPSNANTQVNNYTAAGTARSDSNQIDSRVDHVFSEKWRAFVRYSRSWGRGTPFNGFNNIATSVGDGPSISSANSLSMDHTYTFSPTLLLNLRFGLNRRRTDRTPFSAGFDITQLGFSPAVKQAASLNALEFPRFDVNGLASLGQATFTDLIIAQTTPTFNANVTKTYSRHTLKFGADYRKLMLNFLQFGQPSGQYSFNEQWTRVDPNVSDSTAGYGFASLLLGTPSGGSLSHDPTPASSSTYWGFYVQDDWKVRQNFTVNLGLRYDLDVPRTERYNRYSNFDFDAVSPLASRVPANPFFDPSKLRGAIEFVTAENRRQQPTDKNNFGPRIGFAWNVFEKTVIRAAYGISYSASALQAAGHTGSSGMVGYRTTSSMITSIDGNRTPAAFLDNPFPNGFNFPTGNTLGAETFLGLGIGEGVFLDYRSPYIQQWNLNIQRELPGNILFEIAYLGSKGTRLLDGENGIVLNQVPTSFLSLGTALTDSVANPFFGIITNPSSSLRAATVTRNQLLRPYPQYTGVTAFRIPNGFSVYHGLTLKADKRFSNGLSFLTSYTWNKLIDDVSTTVGFLGQAGSKQNAYDRRGERAIGSQDIRHRLVMSYVYDLPFGKGRRFGQDLNGLANWFVGGWQVNGITVFQSGLPLLFSQTTNTTNLFSPGQRPNWNGTDPNINTGNKAEKIAKWFNTAAFSPAPAFTFGTTPRVMPNLRGDGVKNFDISIFKNNYFNEGKWNAQFRVEFFNAFNRVQFGNPNTQVGNSNFGIVSGQANGPRQIQLALKLLF